MPLRRSITQYLLRGLGLIGSGLIGLGLTYGSALASGLQVSPVSLILQASENAEGIWLSNTSDNLLHAQIRVQHWTQQDGIEQLTPTQGLVISPPMLEIKPGDKQLVRVIRVGPPPSGSNAAEDSYRLQVDELPISSSQDSGLQFVLHYSVPVFIAPASAAAVVPQLHWQLLRAGEHLVLQVSNTGNGHAQLASMSFTNHAGKRSVIAPGLLGYVLPGATMHWTLTLPPTDFAGGGTLEANINGVSATQNISLADPPH